MGLLTFTLNVTLDGCYDHREMIADDELHDYFTQLLGAGGGILYGRTTYELMEAYWPAAARDEKAPRAAREWALALEAMPKHVVSASRRDFPWHNFVKKVALESGCPNLIGAAESILRVAHVIESRPLPVDPETGFELETQSHSHWQAMHDRREKQKRERRDRSARLAALTALVMGMRANEIVSRVVRDLDDEGRLLWIPDSKTEAGRRRLQVPEFLRPHLLGIAEGKSPEAKLFGEHWRDWVRKWVQRICEAAGVPVVTAHGMRGLHSTLAVEHGVSAQVVAASLGHESSTTTMQSYVKPEAASGAQQKRVMTVLDGGRLAS